MTICQIPGCQEHYGCRLRAKGMQVSPRAQMTRTQNWRPSVSKPPSHWKNIVYSERPDGSKMPVLKPDGTVLRHKEYQEKKSKIDSILHSRRTT